MIKQSTLVLLSLFIAGLASMAQLKGDIVLKNNVFTIIGLILSFVFILVIGQKGLKNG